MTLSQSTLRGSRPTRGWRRDGAAAAGPVALGLRALPAAWVLQAALAAAPACAASSAATADAASLASLALLEAQAADGSSGRLASPRLGAAAAADVSEAADLGADAEVDADGDGVDPRPPRLAPYGLGVALGADLRWPLEAAPPVPAPVAPQGALLEAALSSESGHGRTSFIASAATGARPLTRLDTTWTVGTTGGRPGRWRLGDQVGAAGSWGQPVRYGGIAWSNHLSPVASADRRARPGLLGNAALDLQTLLALQSLRAHLPAGPFELPSVPVLPGQGQMRMELRDPNGGLPALPAPDARPGLLRKGLHHIAVEAGLTRLDYGVANGRYGSGFLTVNDRLGVTEALTREWRAELAPGRQTIGAGGVWVVSRLATVDLSSALSQAAPGRGWLLQSGLEHRSDDWRGTLRTRAQSREFDQLGGPADPSVAIRGSTTASVEAPLFGGSAAFSATEQTRWDGPAQRSATVSLGRVLGPLTSVSLVATRLTGETCSTSVGLTLVRSLALRAE